MKPSIASLIILLFFSPYLFSQKVGLVLSGGGASGMAHIGVLKALEEENIPIDYIVGTSIGAFIGGLYAAGYTASEIEEIAVSEHFRIAANGIIDHKYEYFYKKSPVNPGVLNISIRLDSLFESNIPTNFINPTPIDIGLLPYFIPANAVAQQNFDNLLIPFRCLASNITEGKEEILSSGSLATAIRASMTYPFYIKPISINGNLMFDGGLYNNFPANILCSEFQDVDYIIASNVSSEIPPPKANNLLSQIKNILIRESNHELNCAEGVIIKSDIEDISTFSFYKNKKAIERGYQSTLPYIDSIKAGIGYRSNMELLIKREDFNNRKPKIIFDQVEMEGVHPKQAKYFKQNLLKSGNFTYEKLWDETMRYVSDEKIESIQPTTTWNDSSQTYQVDLNVTKRKPFRITFGGVVSTKPFSTGFAELEYSRLKSNTLDLVGNLYYGKFYNSIEGRVRWSIPFDIPFYLEAKYTNNFYDYFDDRETFIDNKDQSFIVNTEQYWEGNIGLPFLTKGKVNFGISYFRQNYNYYQSTNFNRGDTIDVTRLRGYTTFAKYNRNSLNRKMYASLGSQFGVMLRYINGNEYTLPGSTAITKEIEDATKEWFILKGQFEKYFLSQHKLRFGIAMEGVYSNQPFLQNYTATVLVAPAYEPIPLSKTLFQNEFRALSYLAGGARLIYSIREVVDIRAEAYIFQPYNTVFSDEMGQAKLSDEIRDQRYIGSLMTVFHTPIGPLSASVNYFSDFDNEFSFLLHFGYIIFNERAFR